MYFLRGKLTGKVVIGRGVEREMAGGSGRQGATTPREEEGAGFDRDTGVRPLSTTWAAF